MVEPDLLSLSLVFSFLKSHIINTFFSGSWAARCLLDRCSFIHSSVVHWVPFTNSLQIGDTVEYKIHMVLVRNRLTVTRSRYKRKCTGYMHWRCPVGRGICLCSDAELDWGSTAYRLELSSSHGTRSLRDRAEDRTPESISSQGTCQKGKS